MKILFEREEYGQELLENLGLSSYAFDDRNGNTAILPYVGYVYSTKINDCIFILPKVFIKVDDSCKPIKKILFGKQFKDKEGNNIDAGSVLSLDSKDNILHYNGLDKMIFGLSTWMYRAINKYSIRHPKSEIIKCDTNQFVNSVNGENDHTLLDIILSLEKFHKDHSSLFTYISILNSRGCNKINWPKTTSKVQPIILDGKPYYVVFRNKNKVFNYDEELIVLFYSVLQYLKHKHLSSAKPNLNYELLRPSQIESMIENGRGTKLLRKIRRKYFKDELVQLWKLLYAFFSRTEGIKSGKCSDEALLVSSFDRVFEDMVDSLISDDIYADLKENKDNKQIDHIYRDKSLLDDSDIFFIGDSKYYSEGHNLEEKSIYKQFTYAKNIIQLNIDLINDNTKPENGTRYRDELTEGYNFTPNFFIRGQIDLENLKDGKACYSKADLQEHEQKLPFSCHFENRPFDRDTLILQSYNMNFLYILASYVSNSENNDTKRWLHSVFRTDLTKRYDKKFKFYKVTPIFGTIENAEDKEKRIKDFVQKYFYEFRGQMYRPKGKDYIIFGFDKCQCEDNHYSELEKKFKDIALVEESSLEHINLVP